MVFQLRITALLHKLEEFYRTRLIFCVPICNMLNMTTHLAFPIIKMQATWKEVFRMLFQDIHPTSISSFGSGSNRYTYSDESNLHSHIKMYEE
jgi:predicted alternative tryptophan synthase beta-subunit